MGSVAETLAAASPWYPPLVPAAAAALAGLAAQPKSTANAAAVDLLVLEQLLKLADPGCQQSNGEQLPLMLKKQGS